MKRTCLRLHGDKHCYACSTWALTLAVCFSIVAPAHAQFTLVKISADSFHNSESQHKSEVEPDVYSWGNTLVSAFQVARIYSGGGADLGFATTTDAGKTWTRGYLPGLTDHYKHGTNLAASDASVVYNAKYGVWLICSLPIGNEGEGVAVSRSKDGIHWDTPVLVDGSGDDDKNWITCDNNAGSPYYGSCYAEWDIPPTSSTIFMSTSTDGGLTWGPPKTSADQASGTGGEPLVLPNGNVVVPYFSYGPMMSFISTDGGKSWSQSTTIAQVATYAGNSNLRSVGEPFPSTGIDASGKIYIVWSDCSFRQNCSTNDLVMSTSKNGKKWTKAARIPIDPLSSTVDHFIPGLGVDRATSGKTAHLTATYYYYPDASCNSSSCQLDLGFTTSANGGQTWTAGKKLAGPMSLSWLPDTFSGVMVADYLSTSYVAGNPFGVFMVAKAPSNGVLNEAAYTTKEPLLVLANEPRFSAKGDKPVPNAKSDHEWVPFRDVDREAVPLTRHEPEK
jgi:hypothetical protein